MNARRFNHALTRQPLLTIIVPVYNERQTIERVLQQLMEVPYSRKEVIVVNDGSSDGTAPILERWAKRGDILVLHHPHNLGKGAAIRTALAQASGELTIIQDADLEYATPDYPYLLEPLLQGHADVVYGSRYLRTSTGSRPCWRLFRYGVGLLNLAVWWLYGVRLTDEATCYKVFPTELLRAMDLQCQRFEFCAEVTAKACRMGLTITEVPIHYTPRGAAEGKKIRMTDGWEALVTLVRWRTWRPPSGINTLLRQRRSARRSRPRSAILS
jgi:dolichol-phosphate mannosyltransferase